MAENRQTERRPIQTSAVIVLGAKNGPALPPPSPPTPCALPTSAALEEPSEPFCLEELQKKGSEDQQACSAINHESPVKETRLRRGIHVLNTEALALANLTRLYETDPIARSGFDRAVQAIARQAWTNGKLIIIGVGKSGHIGKKLVATMQSLDIRAVFLHPTEALHGDLGIVDHTHDTLMFITYSGKTEELMLVLPHLDESLPTILLTSHVREDTCEFIKRRPSTILLPAPIPEGESVSFGVPAPSTSTTAALALGDALAITVADELHQNVAAAFAKNHPGGSIGMAMKKRMPQTLRHIIVRLRDMPDLEERGVTCETGLGLDVLRGGFDSPSGWVKLGDKLVSPGNIRGIRSADMNLKLRDMPHIFTSRTDMIIMSCDTTIRRAGNIIRDTAVQNKDVIIGVTDGQDLIGALELGRLIEATQQTQQT